MSHSRCILSFDLIGENQNKRFYVKEIVLPLIFADVIFRREKSDNRKYVCSLQPSFVGTVTKIKINPLSFKHLLSILTPIIKWRLFDHLLKS